MNRPDPTTPEPGAMPPMEAEFARLVSRIHTTGSGFALANSKAGEDRSIARYHAARLALWRHVHGLIEAARAEAVRGCQVAVERDLGVLSRLTLLSGPADGSVWRHTAIEAIRALSPPAEGGNDDQ